MVTPQVSVPPQGMLATAAPGFSPGVPAGRDLVPLRAAFGQDEANHGTERYAVDNESLVRVPKEAVAPLITVGGFVLARTGAETISVGPLKLHHHDAAGCSYAGRQYLGDASGNVLVPAEAASQLVAHGFVPVVRGNIAAASRKNRREPIVP